MRYITNSETETKSLGEKFGKESSGGEVFLLTGELGGGKTQFVKGLAFGLGIKDNITSPTFNYQNIYEGTELRLYHFDLYREDQLDEDIKLLLAEAMSDQGAVTVVEWAERGTKIWPKTATRLNFEWVSENKRKIEVSS